MNKSIKKAIFIALNYITFCLAFWYYTRGFLVLYSPLDILSNDIVAALLAGIMPTLIFELAGNSSFAMLFSKPTQQPAQSAPYYSPNQRMPKRVVQINEQGERVLNFYRFIIMAGNLVCFALSFIYFNFKPLYALGSIAFNFVIHLICTIVFIIIQCRRIEDKSKIGQFIISVGFSFLVVYGIVFAIRVGFSILY